MTYSIILGQQGQRTATELLNQSKALFVKSQIVRENQPSDWNELTTMFVECYAFYY
jgi:hypothetical protein